MAEGMDELRSKIERLERENSRLKRRLAALEKRLRERRTPRSPGFDLLLALPALGAAAYLARRRNPK